MLALQDLSLEVLAVVLQHAAVAANQRIVCTLLQVCKAWRAAVQQSASGLLSVQYVWKGSIGQLPKLLGFAGWLANHMGMVSQLSIYHQGLSSTNRADAAALMESAKQILPFGVQTAAAAAASGLGALQHLHTYISSIPATAGLLAALPAATLTQLELRIDSISCPVTLSMLSNLQRLCLTPLRAQTTNSCLQEIGRLQQLLHLEMWNVGPDADMQLLPTQLQQLQLVYYGGYRGSPVTPAATVTADLQHMTCLQCLRLEAGRLSAGSSLPCNLQSVSLQARLPPEGLVGLDSLHQVSSMQLEGCGMRSDQIRDLQRHTSLTHLSLGMQLDANAMQSAAYWHKLPLCVLRMAANTLPGGQLHLLMSHIAAATQLTQLEISISDVLDLEAHGLAICERLVPLKQLRSLKLGIGQPYDFSVQDAQHLAALTRLTSLDLCRKGSGPYLDAPTISLLAVSLTQLRLLCLGVGSEPFTAACRASMPALPVIGKLRGLESLCVGKLEGEEAHRGLKFLTGLSRLTLLDGLQEAGADALSAFWATIRSQRVQ